MSRLYINAYGDFSRTSVSRRGARSVEAEILFNFNVDSRPMNAFRVKVTADDEHVRLTVVAPGSGRPISTVIFERETQMSLSYRGEVNWEPEEEPEIDA